MVFTRTLVSRALLVVASFRFSVVIFLGLGTFRVASVFTFRTFVLSINFSIVPVLGINALPLGLSVSFSRWEDDPVALLKRAEVGHGLSLIHI